MPPRTAMLTESATSCGMVSLLDRYPLCVCARATHWGRISRPWHPTSLNRAIPGRGLLTPMPEMYEHAQAGICRSPPCPYSCNCHSATQQDDRRGRMPGSKLRLPRAASAATTPAVASISHSARPGMMTVIFGARSGGRSACRNHRERVDVSSNRWTSSVARGDRGDARPEQTLDQPAHDSQSMVAARGGRRLRPSRYRGRWRCGGRSSARSVRSARGVVRDAGMAVSGYCAGGMLTARDVTEWNRRLDDIGAWSTRPTQSDRAVWWYSVAGWTPATETSMPRGNVRWTVSPSSSPMHVTPVSCSRSSRCTDGLCNAVRLCTLRQANDWCDALGGGPEVGIAVDTYNVWWDPDLEPQIERAAGRIAAYHVSDWLPDTRDLRLDRGMPGDGVIDLRRFAERVAMAGYHGFHEVEILSNRWWRKIRMRSWRR